MLLGLGFSFLSGATEAWLVDGLHAAGYQGTLDAAFARGQIAGGAAMLTGTVAGGVIAQATNLGVPYVLRAVMLALTFGVAYASMHDVGFTAKKRASFAAALRDVLAASLDHGFRNPPVRWLGSVVFQPGLGKVADASGYPASYVIGAGIELLALPFVLLARRERASSDPIVPGTRGDRCSQLAAAPVTSGS